MRLYNTLTREKEEFIPIVPGEVRIYACGPTVYNFFHIGNARPFITFDTLRRYLEYKGYKVLFVQNFTDIDDKMITQANAEEIEVRDLAERFIQEYFYDADRLNIKRSSFQPKATDCIDEIIEMIQILDEKGYAYTSEDGVYFNTDRFKNYGKLSGFNLEELEENAGERLTSQSNKKNKADFVLWKFRKEGEPFWNSPWGEGRPGWHIECSAMSRKYLGDSIDIHCGGQDLIFPHHENEIAQSEAVTGKPFVRYWMHNGFININNHKMSKSSGNFFTIRDISLQYSYNDIRFFILSSHYRSPINFSEELLESSSSALERIRNCIENINFVIGKHSKINKRIPSPDITEENRLDEAIKCAKDKFDDSMDDDLNTAEAISHIFDLVREINIVTKDYRGGTDILRKAKITIVELCNILGIHAEISTEIPKEIIELSNARITAKQEKDYRKADEIRDQIQQMGYDVSDTPVGPKITPR
jgi:cysteinyl-tRNA synthetase